jgi:hypothetical protein
LKPKLKDPLKIKIKIKNYSLNVEISHHVLTFNGEVRKGEGHLIERQQEKKEGFILS